MRCVLIGSGLLVKSAKEYVRKKSSNYIYCRQLSFESCAIKIFSSKVSLRLNTVNFKTIHKAYIYTTIFENTMLRTSEPLLKNKN
jgi:hypothetical protein